MIKVGVIGAGNMGKNHVRIYSELKGIKETYVFDIDKKKATGLKEYGIIACKTMEEIFNKVDAVSICVPTKYHFDVAKKAIEKGVHCLIEKPITSNVSEGEELVNLLENKDLVVGVGHIERFNPVVEEIVKIIDEPLYIEIKRHNPGSARIKDSTIVEDLMIHDIDIVFNVLHKYINRDYKLYSVWNNYLCNVLIKLDSSIVSLSTSKKASKKIRTVYIEEEDFTIEGDFMNQEIYVYKKPKRYGLENERYVQENIIEKVLVNKVEPLKEELKTFITCVKKGEEFSITPMQALNNLKICEEIKK